MKRSKVGLFGGGAAVAAGVAIVFAGHHAPAPPATGVSAGEVTLVSSAIALPVDDGHFPPGAHAELVDANCTACHSAAMALSQPPLSADQWQAEVKKMREAYHAPVAEADMPAIVAYLAAMPSQRKGLAAR